MNLETLARPYARAMFEHSEGWSNDLNLLEEAANNPKIYVLISSPHMAYKEKVGVFVSLFRGQVESKTINFLKVLGSSKRLSLIPQINSEYKKLLAKKEDSSEVLITSAFNLTKDQADKISIGLKKRYGENTFFKTEIDNSLIGGFSTKNGDEVIDYSIKAKLEKLKNKIK